MATNTYFSGSVVGNLGAAANPDDFINNGDGSYTYQDSMGGAPTTFTSADLISMTDNADATWTFQMPDGSTTIDIDLNNGFANLSATGVANLMAALDFNQLSSQQQQDLVTAVSSNAAAIATLSAALGSDAVVDNTDGTYTHTALDGTSLVIDTNAGSASVQDAAGNFTATNVEDALAEIALNLAAIVDTNVSAAALSIQGSDLEVKVTEGGVDQIGLVPLATVASAFPAGSIPSSAIAGGTGSADTDVSAITLTVLGTDLQVKVTEAGNDYISTIPLAAIQDADTDISAAALSIQGTDLEVKVTEDGVDQVGLVPLATIASAFPAGSIPASSLASGAADTDVSGISLSVVGTDLQVQVTEDGVDYTAALPLAAIQAVDTDISAAALSIQGTNLEVKVTEGGVDQIGLVPLATIASAFPAGSIPVSALASGAADTDVSGISLMVVGTDLQVKVTEDGLDYTAIIPLAAIQDADTDISAAALSIQGTDLEVKVTEDGVDQVGLVPLATIASAFPAGSIPATALASGAADTDISGISLAVVGTDLQVKVTEDGVDYSAMVPLSAIGSPDSIDDDPLRAANAYSAGDQMAIAAVGGADEKVDAAAYVGNVLLTNPLGFSGTPSLSQMTALSITLAGPPFNMYIDDSVCPNELKMWDTCENGGAGAYVPVGSTAPTFGVAGSPFTTIAEADGLTGDYIFDFGGGEFTASIEDGWMLWLQYHHKGGTSPALDVKASGTDLPIFSGDLLGTDNSTISAVWGHGSQAFAASIPDPDLKLRWYGESSAHARVMHFESPEIGRFQTNSGSFSGLASNFTPLAGHTALLPGSQNAGNAGAGDTSMTFAPFYQSDTRTWIVSSSRWEMDDYPINSSFDTIHRIWVKPQ
ncbi:MAG: hypothetical protein ACPGVN_06770 [Alphaproteobacteria bacterium]